MSRLLRLATGALALSLLPALASAQSIELGDGRLGIHGYLTQGWAVSDGAAFYGIREDASTDFRYAALQFRYDRGQDGFLVQFNHRRLNESPITDFESSVNLNWAFYERRDEEGTGSLRVGRVPIPRGIYNEQRSIGVLLPMYRAPVGFYDEAAYFSETIDGLVAEKTFFGEARWPLTLAAYAGGWTLLEYDQFGDEYFVGPFRAKDAVGAQVWLGTPLEGLRVGAAAQRYQWLSDAGTDDEYRDDVSEFQGSLDLTRERAMLRGESVVQRYSENTYWAHYVQGGVGLTRQLWAFALAEYSYERNAIYLPDPTPTDFDWHRSFGVGLNYRFTPSLALKAEHHWNRSLQVEEGGIDYTDPPRFRYAIVSLSAAF